MDTIPFKDLGRTIKQNLQELKQIDANEELTKQQKNTKFRQKLKEYAGEDADWTIYQETLMEIEIAYRTDLLMGKIDTMPPITKRIEKMKEILSEKYDEEPEVRDFLIEKIPLVKNIRRWMKQDRWKEEVEMRMRDEALFSSEKRHKLIDSIYKKAVTDGSSKHAEMWLKMSGDLGKTNENNPVQNTFEQFQKALNKDKS